MKINYLKRYFLGIAMMAFLALLVGNAFAATNASRDFDDGDVANSFANNWIVVSPYWQVEGATSYTFVAVTHTSLSGMASSIGVKINAIDSAGTAYDTAESFTIAAGDTQRVFIVPTNHATVNSTNISTGVFLSGTTDFTYGHLRIQPATTHPMIKIGGIVDVTNVGDGFRDATMLSYWGSVIIEANTTGFAMEFIGDMNDSQTVAKSYASQFSNETVISSGVNLQ